MKDKNPINNLYFYNKRDEVFKITDDQVRIKDPTAQIFSDYLYLPELLS